MAGHHGTGGEWQGAQWGKGSGGMEDQMAGEGGNDRVQEGQMAVAGCRGVAGGKISRWGQPGVR